MRRHVLSCSFALATCVVTVAIAAAQQVTVTKEEVAGVRNLNRLETTVACAGATDVEAMPAIKKMGFAAVINLRQASEAGVDVAKAQDAAKAAGLTYVHIPFNASAADPVVVDRFLEAIKQPGNQPAFIHCASGNRAAAMWFVKRVRIDGWDTDRAMKEAEALGLTNATLKQFVTEYVRK
jgi:uncharacterized protein (TIGR01244 family)